jgi:hypothetical protein
MPQADHADKSRTESNTGESGPSVRGSGQPGLGSRAARVISDTERRARGLRLSDLGEEARPDGIVVMGPYWFSFSVPGAWMCGSHRCHVDPMLQRVDLKVLRSTAPLNDRSLSKTRGASRTRFSWRRARRDRPRRRPRPPRRRLPRSPRARRRAPRARHHLAHPRAVPPQMQNPEKLAPLGVPFTCWSPFLARLENGSARGTRTLDPTVNGQRLCHACAFRRCR